MTEIILGLLVLGQSVLIALVLKQSKDERSKLVNAVIAKDAQELAILETVDKIKPVEEPKMPSDWVAESELSDEEFENRILKGQ